MKSRFFIKFLVVFSLFAVPQLSFAICNSPVTLGFDGNQEPDDDEFLYETKKQFELTKSGYENSGKQNSGDGRGYECDYVSSSGCSGDDVIEMPAGHVFEGVVINSVRRYQCKANWYSGDRWEVVNDNVCSTRGFGDIRVGYCTSAGDGKCKKLTDIDCSGYEKTDVNGTAFHGICYEGPKFVCVAVECIEGMRAENGKCVIDKANNDNNESEESDASKKCKDSGGSWSIDSASCSCDSNKNLKEQNGVCVCISDDYTYSESEKKCIKKGGNETPVSGENPTCTQRYGCYSLPADKQKACVACCSVSSAVANWNPIAQTCECVNKSQTFNPDTKMCSGGVVNPPVVVTPTPETYRCDLNKLLELRNKYSNNSEVVRLIDDLIKKCNEGISETEYNNLYINITVIITNIQNTTISSSKTKISNAVAKLNKIASDFNTSVWKNAEGKFNTSRLISDSVAGVVLGTAGGLITSSVVKKNQVESGFEDIQCTVGGQVVAGWGDQFRVGIQ